jgi:hypothetical protein
VIPVHKRRPKVTYFLNFLTALEFIVCILWWSTMMVQRIDIVGACLVRSVPYELLYVV